jgi:hypothetical protein
LDESHEDVKSAPKLAWPCAQRAEDEAIELFPACVVQGGRVRHDRQDHRPEDRRKL